MAKYDLYRDIASRTGGDIYLGVVGPVRSGKSTFIKRFMETLVLDNIGDENVRKRAVDELPQSADGKSIMTTQPKFVPSEAVRVCFDKKAEASVRLVDCVGYPAEGAVGYTEDGRERKVRTPWSDDEIPFEKAAEIGTEKVIREHSTIGILVTADGSFSEIGREAYETPEQRVAAELSALKKPYVIILNTNAPDGAAAKELAVKMSEKYGAPVLVKDVLHLTASDVDDVMNAALAEFPLKKIDVVTPKWLRALSAENSIVRELSDILKKAAADMSKMRDGDKLSAAFSEAKYLGIPEVVSLDMATGKMKIEVAVKPDLFYGMLSEECGHEIADDFMLFGYIRFLKRAEESYSKLKGALEEVYATGYGIVEPSMREMILEEPVMVKQGGQYGIKLKASAPSLHIMRVDVESEVCPIVGTEQQGEDLVKSLMEKFSDDKAGIWETNIFGRSLNSFVNEGLGNKLRAMPVEVRNKMRKTVTRIVNEGKGGVICILL